MRPRSAAILACRIIALVIGIGAITSAVSLIVLLSETGEGSGTGSFWAFIVTQALIAFFLWTQAEAIGGAVARGTSDEPPAAGARTANAHAVGLSIVGVIFSIEAVTGLVATAASAAESLPFSPLGRTGLSFLVSGFGFARGAAVLVEVVTLAIGLMLILRAGDLARYLSRRYPEPDPPQPPPVS